MTRPPMEGGCKRSLGIGPRSARSPTDANANTPRWRGTRGGKGNGTRGRSAHYREEAGVRFRVVVVLSTVPKPCAHAMRRMRVCVSLLYSVICVIYSKESVV